jgi:hypothetical protein
VAQDAKQPKKDRRMGSDLRLCSGTIIVTRIRNEESVFLDSEPNKSLDASGGSVFRIMTGPAMVD